MIINRFEFLQRARIDQQTLEVWLHEEWIIPNRLSTDMEFTEMDMARALLIVDLKERLGVNDDGVGVILHLVDQIHGLRQLVQALLPDDGEGSPQTSPPTDKAPDP